MSGEEDIKCPFCGRDDMDKIGFKSHLMNGDCDEFNETEDIPRIRFN